MLTMYVLLDEIEYEGDALLGVYSSREKAETAYKEYRALGGF